MAAAASVSGWVLSGCGSGGEDTVAKSANSREGYISGDGGLTTIAAEDRAGSVTLAGETLQGDQFSIGEHRGRVMVVNMWVSSCGPCHKEAPDLIATYEQFKAADDDVGFIGIDFRESSPATGRSQSRSWGLPYDSVFDATGETAVQMQGVLAAQPSTAVLDKAGRVAAVVVGAIDRSTLLGLVEDVLNEG